MGGTRLTRRLGGFDVIKHTIYIKENQKPIFELHHSADVCASALKNTRRIEELH